MKIIFTLLFALSCLSFHLPVNATDLNMEYKKLLAQFPLNRELCGIGPEPFVQNSDEGQPMTVACLLASECNRAAKQCSDLSVRIHIINLSNWLLDNKDNDLDGEPGWGLPQKFNTFRNGHINPPHFPYTITTTLVLLALADAYDILKSTNSENALITEIESTISSVINRWINHFFIANRFYAYSPSPYDARFCFNVSSLFAGVSSKICAKYPHWFSPAERSYIEESNDSAILAVISEAIDQKKKPCWFYESLTTSNKRAHHDLLHHSYTLLGLHIYRQYANRVSLPWSDRDFVESLDAYIREGHIYEFTMRNQFARLWAPGGALVLLGELEEWDKYLSLLGTLIKDYGPCPNFRLFPSQTNSTFYPRFAAHILWGMSYQFSRL